jgi:multidrug efflux pump subunit AcrB/outer membrane protein TolC
LALYADNDFGDTSALLISLEGDDVTYRELEFYLNNLEDRLRRIESVSKLRHYGLQNEQISINLDKTKLEKYGISSSMITASLFTQGLTASGASLDLGDTEVPIHISPMFKTEDDIANQIIYSDPSGNMVRVKDIATITREYPVPDKYIRNNAHKSLLISMEMLEGNNIVQFGEDVDQVLKHFGKTLPEGISINRIADQPGVVKRSVSTFLFELLFAIVSVILVTMLLLPLRVASVAASSIPITIFISLGLMYVLGLELNTVTLAALIVVLGMIVDNSIVIVDSYMEKLDQGMSRWHAAIASANIYFKAIFSATLAISITFFPFLFTLKGTFRDFVQMFPWTVTLTLGISLLVAMMVIPYLEYFFVNKGFHTNAHVQRQGFNMLAFIQRNYEKYLLKAFKKPKLTLGIGLLSVLLAVALFLIVPQRLMPVAERNQFAVEIYLPQGSSLKSTAEVADSLEQLLTADKRIMSVTSFIGSSSPRFHTTYAPRIPAKNYAQFIVNTSSSKETEILLDAYSGRYANYFPNAYVRFKQLDYQPVAAPIEVRISGDDFAALKETGDSLIVKMRGIKGICWVRTDFGDMQPSNRVDINAVEANRLGIDKTTVATNLTISHNGLPVTTVWENDYPVTVKLKAIPGEEMASTGLYNEYIHSLIPGVSVPLRQIATIHADWNEGQIVRRNGMPTLTVMADISRGENVNSIFPKVMAIAESVDIPKGAAISYGGANESDEEHLPGIMTGLIISIFMIFMILVIHFKKINLALLVLGSSALSLLGAFLGVLLVRVEFGITSILGIVSLIGILVRNGIIMLDYAEELRYKHHLSIKDAAIEAGKRRMRPIFLTSAAASVGVISMIISSNPLWSPMGAVICFGTITSMILLVFILPVAYWMIFRNHDQKPASNGTGMKPVLVSLMIVMVGLGNTLNASGQNQFTLGQCKKLALENNVQVRNSRLELLASEQVKKAAFTNYFPKICATAMSFRFNNPLFNLDVEGGQLPILTTDGVTPPVPVPGQFAYFPGLSLSLLDKGNIGAVTAIQPIFAGGRIMNGNSLARVGVNVNAGKLILSRNNTLLKTEEQYWLVVSLYEKRQTLVAVEQLLDSIYKEANDAWRAGLINRNEVLKVTLKQSETRSAQLKLNNGIRLASMALCQYIGIPYDSSMFLVDTLADFREPAAVYVNDDEAVQKREEFHLLQQSLKAEQLKTRMKIGEYLPQAGIGAGALYYNIPDEGTTNSMIFGTINIPISDWWGAAHTIKERRYQEEIALNNSEDNIELMVLQIRKSWNELNEARQQIDIAVETISQAEENLKINKDNYKAGIINISDMLEAQVLLQQSKNMLTDARINYRIRMNTYLQATGRYETE